MDLTDQQGGSKITRLGDVGLKNNLIMASNGSLVSTGMSAVFQLMIIVLLLKPANRHTVLWWPCQYCPFSIGSADSEVNEELKRDKISALRKKEQEIQDVLTQKTKELKKICMREAVRSLWHILEFYFHQQTVWVRIIQFSPFSFGNGGCLNLLCWTFRAFRKVYCCWSLHHR